MDGKMRCGFALDWAREQTKESAGSQLETGKNCLGAMVSKAINQPEHAHDSYRSSRKNKVILKEPT